MSKSPSDKETIDNLLAENQQYLQMIDQLKNLVCSAFGSAIMSESELENIPPSLLCAMISTGNTNLINMEGPHQWPAGCAVLGERLKAGINDRAGLSFYHIAQEVLTWPLKDEKIH